MKADFTIKLMKWNQALNRRSMPWKNEKDPYRIWLSEIILQQTRVEQGWAYYERFIHDFPTVSDLAKAPEKKVFKLWEGLGYYSRCRNLIETAKRIASEYKGRFPSDYNAIAGLKGIGPYTAAAISSFAFNLPYPVLDGNVHRVLARYFGITTSIENASGRKFYDLLATALIDKRKPGIYNQAIMDFGAVTCKPMNPGCSTCPLAKDCMAFQNNWVSILPLKKKRTEKKSRWFLYFLVETEDHQVYIRRRKGKDIWKDLYEFPLFESEIPMPENQEFFSGRVKKLLGRQSFSEMKISKVYKQELTHQTIHARFSSLRIGKPSSNMSGFLLVSRKRIYSYPLPRLLNAFLEDAG